MSKSAKFQAAEIFERALELSEWVRQHYLTDGSLRDAPDRETVETVYTLRRAMRTPWFVYGGGPAGDARREQSAPKSMLTLDQCRDALRALDCTPSYVNSVPVKRRPCSPPMYEVVEFHYTVEAGMGCGARLPHTEVLDLHGAAWRVASGRCVHHSFKNGTWREST